MIDPVVALLSRLRITKWPNFKRNFEDIVRSKLGLIEFTESFDFSEDEEKAGHEAQTLLFFYATGRYKSYGRQIFEVGPGLAEALINTDTSSIQKDDAKLPYESFYIITPPGLLRGLYGEDVLGLLVFEAPEIWGGTVLLFQIVRGESGLAYDFANLFPSGPHALAIDSLSDGQKLARALILYITSGPAGKKRPAEDAEKQEKLERKILSARSQEKIDYLIGKIEKPKIAVTFLGSEENVNSSGSREPAKIRRHWVRGHLHRYWTGPKSNPEERKLVMKFTAPYEKCVDNEPAAEAHIYKVQDEI